MSLITQFRSLFTNPVEPYVATGKSESSTFVNIFSDAYVSERSALSISAFYDGVNTISDDLAQLPIGIYQKKDSHTFPGNHPADRLISKEPNDLLTSFAWRKAIFVFTLIKGNSYTQIHRNNAGQVVSLELINPDKVYVFKHEGQLYYRIHGQKNVLHNSEMIHIKGMSTSGFLGQSVIKFAQESMGITISSQKFGKQYFDSSSNPTGVLEAEKTIPKTVKEALKSSWNQNYSGNGPRGVAILEEGMKYKKISITPEEAQFIATRKFGVLEIARWLKIPPHKLKDLEKSAFTNIEQQNIDYVASCLMPWIRQFEQELDKKLFTEVEKQNGFYTKMNVNGLMRGDSQTRAQFYKDMFYIGAMSPNDVRELEDMNPRQGGEEYFTPVNMQTDEQIKANLNAEK